MRADVKPWIPWVAALAVVVGCARTGEGVASERPSALAPGDVMPRALSHRALPRVLEGETIATSQRMAPGAKLAIAPTPVPRVFRETTLFVAPGAAAGDVSIPVDTTEETTIYLLPGGHDVAAARAARVDLALRGPSLLGIASNAASSELVSTQLSAADRPGDYVLSFGAVAAANGIVVDARFPRSPVAMTLTASTHEVLFGDDAFVDVVTSDDSDPISDTAIEARLVDPIAHARGPLLPVVNEGAQRRIALGPSLAAMGATGVYVVEVRVTGSSRGQRFDRFGSVAVHAGPPIARVLAATARPIDPADDGGALSIDVDLEVGARDRLELSAVLVSATDDIARALANTTATLDAGVQRLTLRFAGPIDAGWALRNLRVYSLGTNTLTCSLAHALDVHQ